MVVVSTVIWLGTRLEAVAWMLVDHPPRGLVLAVAELVARGVPAVRATLWLAVWGLRPIPDPVGTVLWQAVQSAPPLLLITRK